MDELCKWILSHFGLISIKGSLGRQAGGLAAGKQLQRPSKGSTELRESGVQGENIIKCVYAATSFSLFHIYNQATDSCRHKNSNLAKVLVFLHK